jgi:hypothetical protein
MAISRKRMPTREATVSRGPSGTTVFIVFLLLAVLCIGAGFTIGRYILGTIGDKLGVGGDHPSAGDGTGSAPGGGTPGGGTPGGGTPDGGGSSGGGAVPAGGGQGSVICGATPLTIYFVQIGAYGARVNADKAVADLSRKGYPGYVIAPTAGVNLYKVRAVTLTAKAAAEATQGRLKAQGYPDCFSGNEVLDAAPVTISGSSLDYLKKIKAGIDAVAGCLRVEGGVWDKYHSGVLNRAEAAKSVDTLLAGVDAAKAGLASLIAPQDLKVLGQAVDGQLAAARANLATLKSYLSTQADADRLSAETSYAGLVDAYSRLGASLRAAP